MQYNIVKLTFFLIFGRFLKPHDHFRKKNKMFSVILHWAYTLATDCLLRVIGISNNIVLESASDI